MDINAISAIATSRLSTISVDAPFLEAARLLGSGGVRMLVVCGADGQAIGVLTRTDAMQYLERGATHLVGVVAELMNVLIISARPSDDLLATWQMMRARGLNHVPILDADERPIGVLTNEDALQALLNSELYQEHILADYVAGIGYR